MKRLRKFAGIVTARLGIDPETALELPRVTMLGNGEIQIENHKGIIEYSDETVRVQTDDGVILVEGAKLFLNVCDAERVVVSGNIFHVMTVGGGKRD